MLKQFYMRTVYIIQNFFYDNFLLLFQLLLIVSARYKLYKKNEI